MNMHMHMTDGNMGMQRTFWPAAGTQKTIYLSYLSLFYFFPPDSQVLLILRAGSRSSRMCWLVLGGGMREDLLLALSIPHCYLSMQMIGQYS